MNRVIKFRAWDTDKKVLVHETDLDILKNIFHIDFMDKEIGPPPIIYNIGRYNDNVLMQFTGLKDMNGKDIYEGDIVKFYFSVGDTVDLALREITGNYEPTEMIDTVEFMDGCFVFYNKNIDNYAYAKRYNEICEIIGNIFETPELLKV